MNSKKQPLDGGIQRCRRRGTALNPMILHNKKSYLNSTCTASHQPAPSARTVSSGGRKGRALHVPEDCPNQTTIRTTEDGHGDVVGQISGNGDCGGQCLAHRTPAALRTGRFDCSRLGTWHFELWGCAHTLAAEGHTPEAPGLQGSSIRRCGDLQAKPRCPPASGHAGRGRRLSATYLKNSDGDPNAELQGPDYTSSASQANQNIHGNTVQTNSVKIFFSFSEPSPTATKVSSQQGHITLWCKARVIYPPLPPPLRWQLFFTKGEVYIPELEKIAITITDVKTSASTRKVRKTTVTPAPGAWTMRCFRATRSTRITSAVPGVTTLVMAENHIKTNSSGLQYEA